MIDLIWSIIVLWLTIDMADGWGKKEEEEEEQKEECGKSATGEQ